MNRDESRFIVDLEQAGEAFVCLEPQDVTALLGTVDSRFPGVLVRYPMNCVVMENDRQFSIQWHTFEQLQLIIDDLALAWSGEAYTVVEPQGHEYEIADAFRFNSFADTVRCTFDHAVNFAILDGAGTFLIVKNGHSQVIGNGEAAGWLMAISRRRGFDAGGAFC